MNFSKRSEKFFKPIESFRVSPYSSLRFVGKTNLRWVVR